MQTFPTPTWSPLQENIFAWLATNEDTYSRTWKREHLVVQAVAGSGKTTTLLELIQRILKHGHNVAYTMFNKATVKEMEEKVKSRGITSKSLSISTAHTFGFNTVKAKFGFKVKINAHKCRDIYRAHYKRKDDFLAEKTVLTLIDHAKNIGVFVQWPTEGGQSRTRALDPTQILWDIVNHHGIENDEADIGQCIDRALHVLELSNADTTQVDFGDMVYWPDLFSLKCEQFSYVLVDEAQDTNTMRRALFRSMLKPGGSLIAVGDRHQAIYGFTGADHDSLDIFVKEFGARELPLDICYSCAPHIVKYAQQWVKEIRPRPSIIEPHDANAEPRKIERLPYKSLLASLDGKLAPGHEALTLGPGDAFLCRNNAPLVRTCFALLRRSIGCRIEGRDIGLQLVKIVESLDAQTLSELQQRLDAYHDHEIAKAQRKEDTYLMEIIHDKCEAISLFIDIAVKHDETPDDVVDRIRDIFTDASNPHTPKDLVVLSSVHKAKGREWPRVFLLGRDQYMPSRYAIQEWQLTQEKNLIYVAVTRAMEELIEVTHMP